MKLTFGSTVLQASAFPEIMVFVQLTLRVGLLKTVEQIRDWNGIQRVEQNCELF